VLKFCYRIFLIFWKSVQAGFYSGPDSVAFGEYADISCIRVLSAV